MWGGVTPFLKVEAEGGVSSPQKYKVRGNLPKGKGVFFICFEILLSGKGLGVKKTDRTSHTKQNGNAVETALPSIKKQ